MVRECLGNLLLVARLMHQCCSASPLHHSLLSNMDLHQCSITPECSAPEYSAPLLCLGPPPALPALCCRRDFHCKPEFHSVHHLTCIALQLGIFQCNKRKYQNIALKCRFDIRTEWVLSWRGAESGFFPRECCCLSAASRRKFNARPAESAATASSTSWEGEPTEGRPSDWRF